MEHSFVKTFEGKTMSGKTMQISLFTDSSKQAVLLLKKRLGNYDVEVNVKVTKQNKGDSYAR